MSSRLLSSFLACFAVPLATACVPGAQDAGREAGPGASPSATVLRIGVRVDDEPDAVEGGVAFNSSETGYIFHSALTAYDPTTGALEPRIAERVPTIENGDW